MPCSSRSHPTASTSASDAEENVQAATFGPTVNRLGSLETTRASRGGVCRRSRGGRRDGRRGRDRSTQINAADGSPWKTAAGRAPGRSDSREATTRETASGSRYISACAPFCHLAPRMRRRWTAASLAPAAVHTALTWREGGARGGEGRERGAKKMLKWTKGDGLARARDGGVSRRSRRVPRLPSLPPWRRRRRNAGGCRRRPKLRTASRRRRGLVRCIFPSSPAPQ